MRSFKQLMATRNFSFGGCGWNFVWSMGFGSVALRAPISRNIKLGGASGGSLVATIFTLDLDPENILDVTIHIARKQRETGRFFGLVGEMLGHVLTETLPEDSHVRANDRLVVSVSRGTGWVTRNELVSKFDSKEDLIEALLTSCHVPYYSSSEPYRLFRGVLSFDGGFTCNTPLMDADTFLVSPFPPLPKVMPPYDVCPLPRPTHGPELPMARSRFFQNALFPHPDHLRDIFEHGKAVGEAFNESNPTQPRWASLPKFQLNNIKV